MEIFIDTAEKKEIRLSFESGLIDGVTTNPSLVARSGQDHESLIKEICQETRKPVSAEVLSVTEKEMLEEARNLAKIHPCVVVKIPLIGEGLKVVKKLSEERIPTNVTLCFSPNQALLAAKAGATYVSVFEGRLDDIGHNGVEVALQCHQILNQYGYKTKVLGASVRSPLHVFSLAMGGIPICTLPFKVFQQLIRHPLTERGLEQFLSDANKKN